MEVECKTRCRRPLPSKRQFGGRVYKSSVENDNVRMIDLEPPYGPLARILLGVYISATFAI